VGLQKLKVVAYSDAACSSLVGSFEAMFNPEKYAQNYGISYKSFKTMSSGLHAPSYAHNDPSTMSLKLIVDSNYSLLGMTTSVSKAVKKFIELTYSVNGEIHQPNFLKVQWGDLDYPCRLKSLSVTYTLFDQSGKPLRAELDTSFIWSEDKQVQKAKSNLSSPDMTHLKVIDGAMGTLPLTAQSAYNDPSYYMMLAQSNQLDHFRSLVKGEKIQCPPLEDNA